MSVPFNDLLSNNAFSQLLLLHGETVTYRQACGTTFERTAIVNRNPPAFINQAGDVVAPLVEVRFHDDATEGIDANIINTGGDQIDISLRYGATPQTRSVFQMISNDGGVTKLAVR